ncbi:hydrolase [Rhizobium dioscoreae]|uniref:Hydrolase n=1 Tax=Rhizobium dioscoreae TaxID=2653122 RepID=A0ABQ0YW21_9HYPH|nr:MULTISPECIES: HAD family hydrolase [Rhizobium]MCZ3380515.1 HAD family hydrolase [Rhizobium sp. AG207R]TWB09152.1 HAD superfamily hydrolase (TIGR01509 family) [Rhizobium sp. ERR1071]GES44064.1 hydrolase [Rhizobium dioscoreae]GES47459.1 hydrolase [Rhizobium dioscoreae]GLU80076.1 hydrolase [Rhizobium sp. NBRC 114257]
MADAGTGLVIFDCDGVLVDSEPLSVGVLIQAMHDVGVEMSEEDVYSRFLGKSLATLVDTMQTEFDVFIDQAFLDRIRNDLYERFKHELKPIDGISATLDALSLPRCVASSSQLERIRLSLGVTGLLDRLEPNIFSASMVKRGKPAPDLFLYAAEKMGVPPKECIVVEDSPAGITAARAAGMTVFAFTGGSHAHSPSYRAELEQLSPEVVFDAMPELIQLVRNKR